MHVGPLIHCLYFGISNLVKFKCTVDTNKYVTKFEFEGINGSPKLILLTFEELKKRMLGETNGKVTVEKRIMARKPPAKRGSNGNNPEYQPLNVTSRHGQQPNKEFAMSTIRSEEKEADLQGNKIVDITKMLASDQYTVGKLLSEFTDKFLIDIEADVAWKDPSKYVIVADSSSRVSIVFREKYNKQ